MGHCLKGGARPLLDSSENRHARVKNAGILRSDKRQLSQEKQTAFVSPLRRLSVVILNLLATGTVPRFRDSTGTVISFHQFSQNTLIY